MKFEKPETELNPAIYAQHTKIYRIKIANHGSNSITNPKERVKVGYSIIHNSSTRPSHNLLYLTSYKPTAVLGDRLNYKQGLHNSDDIKNVQVNKGKITLSVTHRVSEAIRSALEKLNPAFNLVNCPVFESKETSVPSATTFVPKTPEKLTTGFAVNPTLVVIPA